VLAAAAPNLDADHQPNPDGRRISDDGTVDLVWTVPDGLEAPEFELQQSLDPDFPDPDTRYRGEENETVLTGLREGSYHFRVRAGEGPWSEPLTLEVVFMNRGTLLLLVGTGALVAVLTIAAVVRGFLANR